VLDIGTFQDRGVDAAKNNSSVLASCKCFCYLNGTIHLGGICAAFDPGWVSTVELLRHRYLAVIATLDKACQLAPMQSSNAKSLAGLRTFDFGVILRHQVTLFVASVTAVESIIADQSAASSLGECFSASPGFSKSKVWAGWISHLREF